MNVIVISNISVFLLGKPVSRPDGIEVTGTGGSPRRPVHALLSSKETIGRFFKTSEPKSNNRQEK